MAKTKGSNALKEGRRFTLEEWRTWPEDERWELIDGYAYNMSPSPTAGHQDKAFDLGRHLGNFLENSPCKVFTAPLDVYLDENEFSEKEPTVVQPDVMVICDPEKIKKDGIHGAPDFVAEVLSASTAYRDFGVKKELYEHCAVREYWLIQPETCTVYQYLLDGTLYTPLREYRKGSPIESGVIGGFRWVCT